jgi:glycosyltransferase involved in cell wall biosynthesis/MoaA/NifB/PqqE/SkfB family radical SAM enzyme
MKFSIIIPTFDRPNSLARCLESVRLAIARYPEVEVIVVDDGSSIPVATPADSSTVTVIRQPNRGPGAARNRGAAAARGEVLIFLDDDCRLDAGALPACAGYFENPQIGVVGADVVLDASDHWMVTIKNFRSRIRGPQNQELVSVTYIPGCAYAIRAEVFKGVGGFDEAYWYQEDDDLWQRLIAANIALYRSRRFRVAHQIQIASRRAYLKRVCHYNGVYDDLFLRQYPKTLPAKSVYDYFHVLRSEWLRRRAHSAASTGLLVKLSLCALAQLGETIFKSMHGEKPPGIGRARLVEFNLICTFGETVAVCARYWRQWGSEKFQSLGVFSEFLRYHGRRPGSTAPRQLILFVTNRCQADCDHCFYYEKLNTPGRELDQTDYENLSRDLGEVDKIYLSGGEPFLHRGLHRIASVFYRRNRLHALSIPTNGYATDLIVRETRAILRHCPTLKLNLNVSLDGRPEDHDRLRKLPGSYQRAAATIRRLGELKREDARLKININATLMPGNEDQFASFLENLEREFPEVNHINADVAYPRLEDGLSKNRTPPMGVEQARARSLTEWIGGSWPHWNGRPIGYLLKVVQAIRDEGLLALFADSQRNHRAQLPCIAPRWFGVVRENGDYAFCEQRPPVGNIAQTPLRTVLTSARATEERRFVKESHCACSHCIFQEATLTAALVKPTAWPFFWAGITSLWRRRPKRTYLPEGTKCPQGT